MPVEIADRLLQVGLERRELQIDRTDVVLADEPDPRLGVGQADSPPVRDNPAADAGDGLEVRVLGVDQLLAGRQEFALGPERVGGLGLLLGRQGLAGAEPGERQPDRRRRGPQSPSGGSGRC